jgi:hypothetical protein
MGVHELTSYAKATAALDSRFCIFALNNTAIALVQRLITCGHVLTSKVKA